MIASTKAEKEDLSNIPPQPPSPLPKRKYISSTPSSLTIKRSQYCFKTIETLPGFKGITIINICIYNNNNNIYNNNNNNNNYYYYLDEHKAREILTELANDEGVLAILEKYKWTVGCLAELYPEGYVGVSDVCILGLNQNTGSTILLRLRTGISIIIVIIIIIIIITIIR